MLPFLNSLMKMLMVSSLKTMSSRIAARVLFSPGPTVLAIDKEHGLCTQHERTDIPSVTASLGSDRHQSIILFTRIIAPNKIIVNYNKS